MTGHNIADDPIRILYVEDDEGLARLLQKRLERKGFSIQVAVSGEEALEKFVPSDYDIILLDYTLPGINGIDVLRALAPREGEPAVIMLTVGGNEYLAVEAIENGAEDYLTKDVNQTYLELLPHVIRAAVTKLRLGRQNREQQDRLKYYISEIEKRNFDLMQEVQERKELETELREAKYRAESANIAKSDFLANMSHEIRTPMNAVIGLSNILARSVPLTDRQSEFIQTLKVSAESLLDLINDLLDISRIEAYSIELEAIPFDLARIIDETARMLSVKADEKNVELRLDASVASPLLYVGDPSRLRQIILNLCSNAVKFTESGWVAVALSRSKANDAGIERLTLRVEDTGIGISEHKVDQIFDKFVQADSGINRKYGGTGLGLAITKTLVEAMNGTITVKSTLGKGSVFEVTIPLQLPPR